MRAKLLFLLTILLFYVSVTARAEFPSVHCDEGKDARESLVIHRTVAVIASNQKSGAGAIISENEVLTAAHILDNAMTSALVVTCDWKTLAGSVVWIDKTLDLALITVQAKLPDYFPMRNSAHPARFGEPIWVVGHPNADPWKISSGVTVHPNRRIGKYSLIVSTAHTSEGGSGGPLVDKNGNLLGIVILSITVKANGQKRKLASAQPVYRFCAAHSHPYCQ